MANSRKRKFSESESESSRTEISYRLISAVEKGDLEDVRELISSFGLSYSSEWSDGYILLRDAIVSNKHREVIKLLLTSGSRVNTNSDKLNDTSPDTPLHYSVLNNDVEIVKILLDRSADINAKNMDGETPLHIATDKNYIEIVSLLLERSADVNAKAEFDTTPLHIAAEKGYSDIAEHLLKHGAYINCMSSLEFGDLDTPLHLAAKNGCEKTVKVLLSNGADINAYAKNNETPLYIAIENKNEQIVKVLLEHGANVNAEDKNGRTILQLAVENGCSAIFENILEYSLSFNPEDTKNSKLLHIAVEKGYFKVVEVLLKCGIDVNMLDSLLRTPLHNATRNTQEELVGLLLKYGANVNAKDKYENLPIVYAIRNNDVKMTKLLLANAAALEPEVLNAAVKKEFKGMVEFLIQYGANVNAGDEYGTTALHCTACRGNENIKAEIAKLLLKSGANVDALNKRGETTLHAAVEQGYVKVVEVLFEYNANVNLSNSDTTPLHLLGPNEVITIMLLNKGANVNAKKKTGITALHIAVQCHYKRTVEILLDYGAAVCAKFVGNKTSIHIAAEEDNVKIVDLLLKYGADIDSRDKRGRTPLHLACKQGNKEIVVALLKSGADVNILNKTQHTPIEYFKKDPSRSEFIEIGKILKEHFIKMKSANLYLHTSNLEIVENIDSSDIRDECKKELESMKNEKIDSISFYTILTKNVNQVAHYARNENIMQTLKSDEYKTKFPIYASMISNHFKKAVIRMELLEEVRTLINFPLPYTCTEKVYSYLSDEDLRDFFCPETRGVSVFESLESDCDSSSYSIGDYDSDSDYDYESDSEPELQLFP